MRRKGIPAIALASLTLLAVLLPGIALAQLATPKWRYAAQGSVVGLCVLSGGDSVIVLDSQGFLYIIGEEGTTKGLLRFSHLSYDSTGHEVFSCAQGEKVFLIAEAGYGAEAYYLYNDEGKRLWTVYIPGKTVSYSLSPNGEYLAVASRQARPGGETGRIVVSVYKDGKKAYSVVARLASAAQEAQVKVAVSDRGQLALYDPRGEQLALYSEDGELVKSYSVGGPVSRVYISPDGTLVSYCTPSPQGCDLNTVSLVSGLNWSVKAVYGLLAIAPDYSRVAVYGGNGTIDIYTIQGSRVLEIKALQPTGVALAGGDGRYILVVEKYNVRLLDSQGDEVVEGVIYSGATAYSIDPQGKGFAVADDLGRIYFYVNPQEERLGLILRVLLLGIILVSTILALLYQAGRRPSQPPEEAEEIYP
ncbi:MAG: WD40 repeat domain-containing protein [Desulfurococcales archaeon]|nr:WD40 repeat domain-containing protein [Desulfurococcales archaeon]